jgi:hypothetical protein
MKPKLQDRKYLPNGEILFKYYWQTMGDGRSYEKLAKWCGTEGYISPQTKVPPKRMAVWLCMWRWALHNPEKAFEIKYNDESLDWKNHSKDIKRSPSYLAFMDAVLVPVTHSCLNDSQYNRWKKLNNVS